jgi:hypothetical protein
MPNARKELVSFDIRIAECAQRVGVVRHQDGCDVTDPVDRIERRAVLSAARCCCAIEIDPAYV